jgi:hypothetical protein
MIGPITGSVAENEGFPTWSHSRGYSTAISHHWRRWLSSWLPWLLRVPRDRVLMGSSGFAFDDQAMIAHVTSPFTDKIAPYRSKPTPDDPLAHSFPFPPVPLPLYRLRAPSLSLSPSFPRHLSPGTRLVSAREHVAIAQPPGNSITVDHLDHELTPRRARSRFMSASISLSLSLSLARARLHV